VITRCIGYKKHYWITSFEGRLTLLDEWFLKTVLMFWYAPFKFLSVSTLKGKEHKHFYQSLYQVQVFVAAKVAGSDGKNDNSFNQTSLYHDERDHMMAKRPHLNSSKTGEKINALGSVSHSRIVLKLVSLRQMLFVESWHCSVPFWVVTRW